MGKRRLVLIGGGHSHVQVLRAHLMRPLPAELTVVIDRPEAVYSGMVPGLVAGAYQPHELEIDVRALARRARAAVIVAAADRVDPDERRVFLRDRPPIRYDVCSLNVGSTVAGLDVPGAAEHALSTRPIADLVARIEARVQALAGGAARVVVVGAGAAGVELACCVRERLVREGGAVDVTIVSRSERPVPERQQRVAAEVLRQTERRGIGFIGGVGVAEVRADGVVLEDGRELPADLVLWVTGAVGPPLLAASGLPVDERGFVKVADTLAVPGEGGPRADLFAAGDCAVPASWPSIPKAGVYAVREGPVLLDNLRRALLGEGLRRYRPQRDYLMMLNLGDGTAIAAKWGMVATGRLLYRWKDRIDRRFMERFQVLGPAGDPAAPFDRGLPPMPEVEMVCGGCAAKVGEGPLRRALKRLPEAPADPSVVMGMEQADDAVAFRVGAQTVVANVDAFTAFTDDPWLVGRVAAVNAVSDLYAKGARPLHAMALVTVPEEADAEETLFQVLSGARAALDADRVTLLGGHTTVGMQLTVGFAVTGAADGPLWRNDGLQSGDVLVLTRALGTGVLLHADMAGRARGVWMQAAFDGMLRGNRRAAQAASAFPVSAATDVTGFGLAGHLGAMLRASGVSAEVELSRVPALSGALSLLGRGERSTFHEQNREIVRAIAVAPEARVDALELLFDPQTAGGLLIGVPAEGADALVAALVAAGDVDAAIIGRVTAPREDGTLFTVLG